MAIVLHHHPFSRASNVVWMLEEVGVPYELRFCDLMKGAHKQPDVTGLNPMGKLPTLVDGDTVVTESAAIALYLADRYAYGKLCPRVDDPARAAYYRWSLFAPSVVEPGSLAKVSNWDYKPSQAGWGDYDTMLTTMEAAVASKDYLLGDIFTMADVIFGGTLRYMMMFKMVESRPAFASYVARLEARPAMQRADAKNAAVVKEHNLQMPGASAAS